MNDKYNIPKMRTVDSAYDELKRLDPKSDFTKRALRRMISTGELKTVKIGNKHLINFDCAPRRRADSLAGGNPVR